MTPVRLTITPQLAVELIKLDDDKNFMSLELFVTPDNDTEQKRHKVNLTLADVQFYEHAGGYPNRHPRDTTVIFYKWITIEAVLYRTRLVLDVVGEMPKLWVYIDTTDISLTQKFIDPQEPGFKELVIGTIDRFRVNLP